MTRRFNELSETSMKFADWVKKEISNDKKACGMEIRIAACDWPNYRYVPTPVKTIYTLRYPNLGRGNLEMESLLELEMSQSREVKCDVVENLLKEVNLSDFQRIMLEEEVVCDVQAFAYWGIVITVYPKDLVSNKDPMDLTDNLIINYGVPIE
ncbi:MAG: hypothetical protein Q4D02_04525 [Clostridia bacterium]|nr:hypothetical protein [Clostridia bacterium]